MRPVWRSGLRTRRAALRGRTVLLRSPLRGVQAGSGGTGGECAGRDRPPLRRAARHHRGLSPPQQQPAEGAPRDTPVGRLRRCLREVEAQIASRSRLRPACLAAYRAASARTYRVARSWGPTPVAAPTLTPTVSPLATAP